MKHRLFTILSAVSLLLCITVGTLWVRSHWVADFISHRTVHRERPGFSEVGVESVWGSVHLTSLNSPATLPPSEPVGLIYGTEEFQRVGVLRDTGARKWGFGYDDKANGSGMVYWTVWLPHWLIVLSTAALPVAWALSQAKATKMRRRLKQGLCLNCGYDLRGTPERCPECGTQVADHPIQ